MFPMEEIGRVRSNFPHRAGTPRQGLLAPHARSHLVLDSIVAPGSLEGLEGFSHVWVVFRFHINVESNKKRRGGGGGGGGGAETNKGTRYAAKVIGNVGTHSCCHRQRANEPLCQSLILLFRPRSRLLGRVGRKLVSLQHGRHTGRTRSASPSLGWSASMLVRRGSKPTSSPTTPTHMHERYSAVFFSALSP